MSYSTESSETFYHFTESEEKKIYTFLKKRGYKKFDHNTVCGSHCGMYSDEIWVNGIGGRFKKEDRKALAAYMKKQNIEGSIDDYTVDANPDAYMADYRIGAKEKHDD